MPDEKEKKEKKEKKSKKSRKDKDGERDGGNGEIRSKSAGKGKNPPPRSWFGRAISGLFFCSEVSCCRPQEKVLSDKARKERDRDREKKKKRFDRDRDDEATPRQGRLASRNDSPNGKASEDSGSAGSARSCAQSTAGTERSYKSGASRSTRGGGGGRDRDREKDRNRERDRDYRDRDRDPARSGEKAAPVQVLSLADIRGQKLPANLGAQDDNDGSMSARSGRSCRSAAQSEGGRSCRSVASTSVKKYMSYLSEPKSPAEVKKMVKDFVREMVKGREMGVLRADGILKPVVCGLSRSLDVFRIKSGDQVRKVKLAEVERIVQGAPDDLADLETPLDDTCATLELDSAECISFKFAEKKKAELFSLCMNLFIDGQKG